MSMSLSTPSTVLTPGAATGFVTCFNATETTTVVLAQPHQNHTLAVYTNNVPEPVAILANVLGCDTEALPPPGVVVYTTSGAWVTTAELVFVAPPGGMNVSLVVYVHDREWFPVPEAVMFTHADTRTGWAWTCTSMTLKPVVAAGRVVYVTDKIVGKVDRYSSGPDAFMAAGGVSTIMYVYYTGPVGFFAHSRIPANHYVNPTAVDSGPYFASVTRGMGYRMAVLADGNLDTATAPASHLGYGIVTGFVHISRPECQDALLAHYSTRGTQILSQREFEYPTPDLNGYNFVVETRANGASNCSDVGIGLLPCPSSATNLWPPVDLAPIVVAVNTTVLSWERAAPVFVQPRRVTVQWASPLGTHVVDANTSATLDPTVDEARLTGVRPPLFVAASSVVRQQGGYDGVNQVAPLSLSFTLDMGSRMPGVITAGLGTTDAVCVVATLANGTIDRWCPVATLGGGTLVSCVFTDWSSACRDATTRLFTYTWPPSPTVNYTAEDVVALVLTIRADTLREVATNFTFPTRDQAAVVVLAPRELWPTPGTGSPTRSITPSPGTSSTASVTKTRSFTRSTTVSTTTSSTPSNTQSNTPTTTTSYTTTLSTTTTTTPSTTRSASRSTSRSITTSLSVSISRTLTLSVSRSGTKTSSRSASGTSTGTTTTSVSSSESVSPSNSASETTTATVSSSRTVTKSLSGTRTPSRTASATRDWLGVAATTSEVLTVPVIVLLSLVLTFTVTTTVCGVLWYQRRGVSSAEKKTLMNR